MTLKNTKRSKQAKARPLTPNEQAVLTASAELIQAQDGKRPTLEAIQRQIETQGKSSLTLSAIGKIWKRLEGKGILRTRVDVLVNKEEGAA
jgi:hypothetical protein